MIISGRSRIRSTQREETDSVRSVSTHTNLKIEQCLELYEASMLSWDIQMTVEESLLDDKDGVPHGVSDSESESDKDSD